MNGRVLAFVRESGPRPPATALAAARLAQALARAGDGTAALCWARHEPALPGPWQDLWRLPEDPDARTAASAVAALLGAQDYDAVVLESTAFGREVGGRLAQRLSFALAGETLSARWTDAGFEVTRTVDAGRRTARLLLRGRVVLLASKDAAADVELRPGAPTKATLLNASVSHRATELIAEERLSPWDIDVEEADVVVAGGRGVGGPDGFAAIAELASLLNGAVGATRIAVDLGWAPRSCQVGASGKIIAPRLYIACGISGASHHVVGMRQSDLIVAINPDPHAPIHRVAHVSILASVEDVLPQVISRLQRQMPPVASTVRSERPVAV